MTKKAKQHKPCACGSGKKYKDCCLEQDENNATELLTREEALAQFDALDKLSNSVLPMIKAKQFDKAEAVCKRLLREYPDQTDGFDRFSMLYEAKGELAKAIEYKRKMIDFAKSIGDYSGEFFIYAEDDIACLTQRMKAQARKAIS